MIDKCTVKIDKKHPVDSLNILINLARKYVDWLDYDKRYSDQIILDLTLFSNKNNLTDAIEVFNHHFKEYITLEIT